MKTIKSQGYYNTPSKCPPSHCAHAASLCAKEWHYCMCRNSFLVTTVVSFMASTNWCLPLGLSLWYALDFMQLHSKESNGSKMGSWVTKQAKPAVHFFQSTFLCNFRSKFPSPLSWQAELPSHVAAIFILVLQEPHPLNTKVIHFPENFFDMKLLKRPLITPVPIRLLPNTTHHMLTENHCVTWCWFSWAQDCEFLVLVIPSG